MRDDNVYGKSSFPLWALGFGVMVLAVAIGYYATNFMNEPAGEPDTDTAMRGTNTESMLAGTVITLEGRVTNVLDDTAFVLRDADDKEEHEVLVLTHKLGDATAEKPANVSADQWLLVDGKVVMANESDLRAELGADFDANLLKKFDGKHAVIAHGIQITRPADRERQIR
jgi:hypothetical protein